MKNTQFFARTLSFFWGIVWISLCLIFAIRQPGFSISGIALVTSISALFLIGPALLALRWPVAGGIILLIEGLFGLVLTAGVVIFPLALEHSVSVTRILFLLFVLALPPLVSGILFLITRRGAK